VRGVGLGLRWEFLDELMERAPDAIDFVEVSPENYMRRGGYYPSALNYVASRYPVVTHGLTLSLGGVDPLDASYLAELRAFVRDIGSPWHSDHLCFGSADGRVLHDLLPIAWKRASVARIADRIKRARDALGVPLALENISYYLHAGAPEMGEAEFIAAVCDAADCGLMLDINNAYVNATNFGFDVRAWFDVVPLERVVQIHVAGHEWFEEETLSRASEARRGEPGTLILDTHGARVPDPVLALLEEVLRRTGPVPVVLERDQNIPPFDALLAELAEIRAIWMRGTAD
jgi:uncharacterized protein (UPF0276 family)